MGNLVKVFIIFFFWWVTEWRATCICCFLVSKHFFRTNFPFWLYLKKKESYQKHNIILLHFNEEFYVHGIGFLQLRVHKVSSKHWMCILVNVKTFEVVPINFTPEINQKLKSFTISSCWLSEEKRWSGTRQAFIMLTERMLVQWPHLTVTTMDKLLHGTLTCSDI